MNHEAAGQTDKIMLSSSSISQSYSNVPDHSQTGGGYKLNGDLKKKIK
jgi:hypothetical protein